MRRAVKEFGQTIVMVTHDPVAASYADRVVFLEDGKVVDELDDPTPDGVHRPHAHVWGLGHDPHSTQTAFAHKLVWY